MSCLSCFLQDETWLEASGRSGEISGWISRTGSILAVIVDTQSRLAEVEVVQGEFRKAYDNKQLGVFLLDGTHQPFVTQSACTSAGLNFAGIPPSPAGIPQIEAQVCRTHCQSSTWQTCFIMLRGRESFF